MMDWFFYVMAILTMIASWFTSEHKMEMLTLCGVFMLMAIFWRLHGN